ncbi:MAG: hypothetical protein KA035_04385, partial [Candidatus Levybacteria bacterium]|nr:hypothetical protein [Candidatus Levybacteria bacterium]
AICMDPRATTTPLTPASNTQPDNLPPINAPVEKAPFFKSKKGVGIILASSIIVVLVVAGFLFFMNSSKPQTQTPKISVKPNSSAKEDIKTYPKFEFTYEKPTQNPTVPTSLPTYTLKTSFSKSDIASIGARFDLSSQEVTKNIAILSSNTVSSKGILTLNTITGAFTYQNYGANLKIAGDKKAGAKNFLAQVGLSDSAIECDITYEDALSPEITFVECHRSWEKLGAPLFNLPGTLNISEDKKLSEIKLGMTEIPIPNSDIVNVSTGQNGINRPNDFNTATLAIAPDNTLIAVNSNFRWIESQSTTPVATPEQALFKLQNQKATTTLALPSGEGNFDWNRIFPSGTVTGNNATIHDFDVVYIENESSQIQNTYTPMYIARGNVLLSSGYRVNYVQTTSAVKDNSLAVAQNNTQPNLQLQTFTLPPTKPVTPAPTTKKTIPTPTPNMDCKDGGYTPQGERPAGTEHTIRLPDGGTIVIVVAHGGGNTFYVKSAIETDTRIVNLREQFFKLIADQFIYNYIYNRDSYPGFRTISSFGGLENFYKSVDRESYRQYVPPQGSATRDPIPQHVTLRSNFEKRALAADSGNPETLTNPNLPGDVSWILKTETLATNTCYLTGSSPTIFLYSSSPRTFVVDPAVITYADPRLTNKSWNFETNQNGILTFENFKRDFLYYEFNPERVSFSKQDQGFVLAVNDIKFITPKLASLMKLNNKETERLLFELQHAAKDLPSDITYIKISLVPTEELNAKLPLNVSPRPEHTNRYHFLLTPTNKNERTNKPIIPAVKRGNSTLVEIGASSH